MKCLSKTFVKAAVYFCTIFTLLFSILLSIDETRNLVFNSILQWKEKYTEIQFGDTEIYGDIYRPTYLPEGFSEKSIRIFGDTVMIIYSNEADVEILLNQRPAKSGTSLVDNENTNFTEVKVAGNTAYLFKAQTEDDANVLIWSSNDMVFELVSKIESKELLFIGESLKK